MDDAPSRKDIPYSYCPVTQRRGIWPVRQAAKTWHFQKLIRTILSLINSFPNNDQKKKKNHQAKLQSISAFGQCHVRLMENTQTQNVFFGSQKYDNMG